MPRASFRAWHLRSTLVAAVVLPLGIFGSFVVMRVMGISANIMSLAGIAVTIGAMVDASVVLVENLHKHKERAGPDENHWVLVGRATKEVGPALFHSLLIITVSFLPVFSLEGQAGRLFKPLAYTKTFAMAASAIIAVTVIPVVLGFFVRGHVHPESRNPVNRFMIWLYMPFIRFALRFKALSILVAFGLLALTLAPSSKIGSEFMPPLREGDILYMPTTVPGLSVTEARRTLQIQDELLAQFPEVRVVLGKIGRSTTPTDPAPLSMVETHASLRSEEHWPHRLIKKGYLRDVGRRMLGDLRAGGFLAAEFDEVGEDTVAEQVEDMSRWKLNRQTRVELMEHLRINLPKLRDGLETHRQDLIEHGESPRPRFDDQVLEDEWGADMLRQMMQQIVTEMPQRITHDVSNDLLKIVVSHNAIDAERMDDAVAHLIGQWDGRIRVEDVPLVPTTFDELTKS